nr:hypothetical protein CFP56_34369 [Quercus suber]
MAFPIRSIDFFQTPQSTTSTPHQNLPCLVQDVLYVLIFLHSKKFHRNSLAHSKKRSPSLADYNHQLGPQQLKYMTFLRDSSDCFIFSSLNLLETIAEVEEERFLVWELDLRLFFACCCADLMIKFHLQIPWSFMASTTPTLAATIALPVELIFYSSQDSSFLLKLEAQNSKLCCK